jgi:hypothetical protein
MGELLRQGFDAQLADRNTKDYDLLVGHSEDEVLRKVQVKTVRVAPWYVRTADFTGDLAARITVYVLLGSEKAGRPVRYFIARNNLLAQQLHHPKKNPENPEKWAKNAFMPMKAVQAHENKWDALFEEQR